MFFRDDEKEGRIKSLEDLKDIMMDEMGDRMGKLKKPMAASMTIEKIPKDDMDSGFDSDDDEGMEGKESEDDQDDISEEDKDRIRELYHKFCV